jgi:uncharacterized membrane protein
MKPLVAPLMIALVVGFGPVELFIFSAVAIVVVIIVLRKLLS